MVAVTLTQSRALVSGEPGGVALPPFDGAAEAAVVASLLVDPARVWDVAATGLAAHDFFREANLWAYEAIMDLAGQEPVDGINQITVAHELARRGRLKEVGGMSYLSKLITELPTAVGVEYYARLVHELAQHRRLISVAHAMMQDAYTARDSADDLVSRTLDRIIAVGRGAENGHRSMKQMFAALLDARDGERGVSLGFPSLGEAIPTLGDGDMMVVAAQTSVGKTAFVLNVAHRVALGQGKRVAVFSAEMGDAALFLRLLSLECGISGQRIVSGLKHGDLGSLQEQQINEAGGRLCDAPIKILDSTGWSVQHLAMEARRITAQSGVDLLIVDYLQLLSSGGASENRAQEVSLISRALKALAGTLSVPVIAVSQLNRQAGDKERPHLRHLRESGSIEQDADVVMFLHAAPGSKSKAQRTLEAYFEKNRNGPLMETQMLFDATVGRFTDAEEQGRDGAGRWWSR